jgi:hypothetical protein
MNNTATAKTASAKFDPNNPLGSVLGALLGLKGRMHKRDQKLNDPNGDGSGDGAEAPTGVDYNVAYKDIMSTMLWIEQIRVPTLGRLTRTAASNDDFVRDVAAVTAAGAKLISVQVRDDSHIQYVIELEKSKAFDVLGVAPDSSEWMGQDIKPNS